MEKTNDNLFIAVLPMASLMFFLATSRASLGSGDNYPSHSTSVRWEILSLQDQRNFVQNSDKLPIAYEENTPVSNK